MPSFRCFCVFALNLLGLTACLPSIGAGQNVVINHDTVLTQDVAGDLIITNAASVIAQDVHVGGNVIVTNGANFYGMGVFIENDLRARFAGNVILQKYYSLRSRVLGDIEIRQCLGALRLFDVRAEGEVLFDDNLAFDIVVRNSFAYRNIQLFNNIVTRRIVIGNTLVWGNIQTHANQPGPALVGNLVHSPPADGSLIEIMASGDMGDERIELRIDGQPVRDWMAEDEFQVYRFKATNTLAADRIQIAYTNDSWELESNRNLFVDYISIDGSVFQTEAPTVYSTGTWKRGEGVSPGFHESETLHVSGYFQYGLTELSGALLKLELNAVLPNTGSSQLYDDGTDIRFRSLDEGGNQEFTARFGTAGVIAEMKDATTDKSLLAPTWNGELTDRVVQWTIWEQGQTMVYDVPSLPHWEDRFNMTQGGNYAGHLNGTVDVELNEPQGRLDVWSVADKQWKTELEPFMDGAISMLTRYELLDGGAILVRRVARTGRMFLLDDEVPSVGNPMIEGWNPFSDNAFNALALSIDNQGEPTQFYVDSVNVPYYPRWPVAETRGWAMVYDQHDKTTGPTNTVVFGKDQGIVYLPDGTTTDPRRFVLNSMDFTGGLAVLPGFWTDVIPEASIVDQYYIYVPAHGIKPDTAAMLDALSTLLPKPKVYRPGALLPAELSIIADALGENFDEPRLPTDNLSDLR